MLDASLEKLPLKEDYAFHPEKRAQLVQTLNKGTPEYYLYQMQWSSQQHQKKQASGQPLTAEEIDAAFDLLREASQHVYDEAILTRFRSQLAVLAYSTKPELLLKELDVDENLLKEAAAAPQAEASSSATGAADATAVASTSSAAVRPQELGILKDLPTALDQEVIASATIIKKIVDHLSAETYDWSFPDPTPQGWAQLLSNPDVEQILLEKLAIESLENLVFGRMGLVQSPYSLEIIGQADTARVDVLVVKMLLRLHEAGRLVFTSRINSLQYLTLAQLELMRQQRPSLMDDTGFVSMLERRIVPALDGEALAGGPGSSKVEQQAAIHQDWLNRMIELMEPLSPMFNADKLAIYYMDLKNDLQQPGRELSKTKFLRLVQVPQRLTNPNYEYVRYTKGEEIVDFRYTSYSTTCWSTRLTRPSQSDLDSLIEEYLDYLLLQDKSTKDYEAYFDKSYLDGRLARVMLLSGDKDTTKWARFLPPHLPLDKLTTETFLKFASDNPTQFMPSDKVSFKLRAKNAGRILVRVFEIKTFEYLQHYDGVVGQSLDLDGLSPNWELNLTSDRPPIEQFEVTIDLPQLPNKRGAFVMDVISNGANSCIFFTKGYLDYTERFGVAGHILTILDENNQAIRENCSVWLDGHTYQPKSNGDILIPYSKTYTGASTIKLIHDGFTTERPFQLHVEDYRLRFACHLDREAVVSGHAVKVLLKPTLLQSGPDVICPLGLLEQVVLEIESTDMDGTSSTTTVNDFKLDHVNWSSYTLQIPENLREVQFRLSGRVKKVTTGEYQDLAEIYCVEFQNPETDMHVNATYKGRSQSVQIQGEIFTVLRKTSKGYHVVVMGKNGEKRTDVPLQFEFYHSLWSKNITQYLRSNEQGIIDLGHLKEVRLISCPSTGNVWNLEDLHHDRYSYPKKIHAKAGETIQVPLLRSDVPFIRQTSLFSYTGHQHDLTVTDCCALKDCTKQVKKQGDFLVITNLDAGFYTLRLGTTSIDIVMAKSVKTVSQASTGEEGQRLHTLLELGQYRIEPSPTNRLNSHAPIPQLLFMSEPYVDTTAQAIECQLYQWSSQTRVCVIASKFAPAELCYDQLAMIEPETPSMTTQMELASTLVRTGRILSEEYQYILNRKAQSSHWVGNLLTKPSTLLTPWSVADTSMDVETMKPVEQDQVRRVFDAQKQVIAKSARMRRHMAMGNDYTKGRTPPLLSFLAQPSTVLLNLLPDHEGRINIPLQTDGPLKDAQFIQVIAVDGRQMVQRTVELALLGPLDFKTRDLRFKSMLDYQKHYIAERSGTNLIPPSMSASRETGAEAAASVTLASTGSSSAVRVIQSVRQVYDLLLTLVTLDSEREKLRTFGFVVDWARLSASAKNEKLSKFCSHELNLFLYEKDRGYFDSVVAPFLKNKLVKSFVDEYLLELPLEKYCQLNEFQKLTALEKALLARRIPSMRPIVTRWFKDRVPRLSTSNNIKLFQTIMKSGSLDEAPAFSPTSPAFSPYQNVRLDMDEERDEEEDSDEDMGFALMDDDAPSAPRPPAPVAARKTSWLQRLGGGAPAGARAAPAPVNRFGGGFGSAVTEAAVPMSFCMAEAVEEREVVKEMVAKQFKQVDLTKVQVETYYYQRQDYEDPYGNNSDANAFWLDYVQWQGDYSVFLSQNFVVNTNSFTDAMATLALMGVSLKAATDATVTRSETRQLVVSSKHAAIVFHASTKEVAAAADSMAGTILLTQKYYAQDEKFVYDERLRYNVRQYLSLKSDLRPLKSYGAHVILMNATPNPANVFLDIQLPQGAISIYDTFKAGHDVVLAPHATFQYEYGFYFPEAGDFPHYPAHVSDYEQIVAYAEPVVLHVRAPEVDRASEDEDKMSWPYLLQWGTKDDIIRKLEQSTLTEGSGGVPMDALERFMVKDPVFYKRVVTLLRERREYYDRVWRLSVVHGERESLREYLARQVWLTDKVGYWFESSLLTVQPTAKAHSANRELSFEVLEFFPLINARAHKTKRDAVILNNKFREQYDKYMTLLSQKPVLDREDLLLLVVYLVAQERIVEAKEKFGRLSTLLQQQPPQQSEPWFKLQHDYLWCYLQLCVETPNNASAEGQRAVAHRVNVEAIQKVLDQHRQHPVKRWREMFEDMQKYVDEIAASEADSQLPPPVTVSEGASAAAVEHKQDDMEEDSVELVERPGSSEPMEIDEPASGSGAPPQVSEARRSGSSSSRRQQDMTPTVEFKIGADNMLTIRHRAVHGITVEYYAIDAEAMFSASPLTFVDQGNKKGGDDEDGDDTSFSTDHHRKKPASSTAQNSYRYVTPNKVDVHTVQPFVPSSSSNATDGVVTVPILPQYVNTNCMISVTTNPPSATKQWRD
ncbi:hypothetical protein BGZ73_005036, partial [Actinomortierella ambigua]